jgi:2'-5' RNA ligase
VRLFVAVNLPGAVRRALWAAAAPLREARLPVKWTAEEALHLTLKFLGEVEEQRAAPIGEALTAAVKTVRPFDIGLGGFGAFPTAERPRVLWIGLERHPALELLANDVERSLGPHGFAPELKPFHPHLTIGRVKKGVRPAAFRGLEALGRNLDYESVVRVESVDLMHSTLHRSGPTYRIVHRAMLGSEL